MSAPLIEPANNELVVVAWAQSLPGIPAGKVGVTLPSETAGWTDTGFVQVEGIVGGSPHPDFPLRRPVVQFGCWATRGGSSVLPPWGLAHVLVEWLLRACEPDSIHRSKVVTTRTGFENALIQDATAIGEPRRMKSDPAGYAHVTVDIQIPWTRVEE